MRLFVQKVCTVEKLTHNEDLINIIYYLVGQLLLCLSIWIIHPHSSLSFNAEHLSVFLPYSPSPVILGFSWTGSSQACKPLPPLLFLAISPVSFRPHLVCSSLPATFPGILDYIRSSYLEPFTYFVISAYLFSSRLQAQDVVGGKGSHSLPWAPELSVVPVHNQRS